jgi:hypothetical protein
MHQVVKTARYAMAIPSSRCRTKRSSRATSTPRVIVLIRPKELDDLKLEAKHTIDMVRFVDHCRCDDE